MSAPYVPPPAAEPQPQGQPPRNGLGTAGFVLGLVGLLLSFIPFIGVVAWPLVIVGLILSIVGIVRASSGKATNRGLAITGAILSVIGLVICIVYASAFTKAVTDVNQQQNAVSSVGYDVTGDAKGATVTYSTFDGNGASTNQETAATLPWHKDLQAKGLFSGGSLTVTAGPDGGSVTCKVTVNGKESKTASASGPFATASCSNF
ncbi:MmpS family transport accessory protein [Kutzneria sp. NPDC052558]|uniref:MmpS family transport accessory protein n=1 Tax=Kutzneria sp. NPDC052558 TaxID=3364121 RepID=UPI0037C7C4B7